jgi:hypothetical protein
MVASKNKRSEIADSIKALMTALDDQILPHADDMRNKGWVSAEEYGKATNRSTKLAKSLLDGSKTIRKQKCRSKFSNVMMYKAR